MKKMPCLFVREFHGKGDFTITEQVTPGCEWVLAGEGVATRKWDGTAIIHMLSHWYRRYDSKSGKLSFCFYPCEPGPDPVTKHWPGWTPINMGNEDQYVREAIESYLKEHNPPGDGTYEAIGPKINSNKEKVDSYQLKRHGDVTYTVERSFEGLRKFLSENMIEGIVFHHPDGRRCKIRRDDFGLEW